MKNPYNAEWLPTLKRAVRDAGDIIMQHRKDGVDVSCKADNSPVTNADRAADKHICSILLTLAPHIPVISEEGSHQQEAAKSGTFWCVDPLDGTKGYIRGEDEFTVNIGLIHNFMPIFGIIYIPAMSQLYHGESEQRHAYREDSAGEIPITVRQPQPKALSAITSKRHTTAREQALRNEYGITSFTSASSSLKFCRIAEGVADIYPRFGNTMEWDTAAGHAILKAAGGEIYELDTRAPLAYGKEGFLNSRFVATSSDLPENLNMTL